MPSSTSSAIWLEPSWGSISPLRSPASPPWAFPVAPIPTFKPPSRTAAASPNRGEPMARSTADRKTKSQAPSRPPFPIRCFSSFGVPSGMPQAIDYAAFVAAFIAACAILDYRTRKIPNWLTVSGAVLGLAHSILAPHGIGPLMSLAGLAIGFLLLLLPWLLGGGGMGDVKMLAALGAWLGPLGILVAFGLGSVLAAGGMIIVLTASLLTEGFSRTRRRYVGASAGVTPTSAMPRKNVRRVLPFAVPMAISTWLILGWMLLKAIG